MMTRKLRRDLANFYHLVEHFGWSELIFNHISVRLPGRDAYLVNPSASIIPRSRPIICSSSM
jgi:ribulose-5-phosphate 4-epimerase/fuculose-1-phosphate aldolase